jgi:hypothetical protein
MDFTPSSAVLDRTDGSIGPCQMRSNVEPASRPLLGWTAAKLLAAVFVVSFYVGSAHRTVGHQKDFFSQWTLARLAVEGRGSGIYDPKLQREIAQKYVAPGKLDFRSDFYDRVGVSPYPPVMALLYSPLGWLSPQTAQWCMVQLAVVLALVTAWAITTTTQGRIGSSTALLAVCCFPGFFYNVALGQNAAITLALFALGWRSLASGKPISAGATWGVLAYKVHWVVALGWLPFVLKKYRAYVGLALSVAMLVAAATLVFGPDVWSAWLVRVRAIAAFYGEQPVQLGMACDLRATAHRYLPAQLAKPAGWGLLAIVGAISWWRFHRAKDRSPQSPAACVLLFGAGLIAPYMMYYDVTVFVLPLLLLWSYRAGMTRSQVATLIVLTAAFYASLPVMDHWPQRWQGPPWATLAVLGLWGMSIWVAATIGRQSQTATAASPAG